MDTNFCPNCFEKKETSGVCPHCGYDAISDERKFPMALRAGTVLGGKYIIGRVLGEGGFGITYLAQDYRDKTTVALKEFFPDSLAARTDGTALTPFAGDREDAFTYGKECFLEEAKTLSRFIGNDSIVRVYSYFEENNTAYFAMEYIKGKSLLDYLNERGGKISFEDTKKIILPVMDALEAIHGEGIVHRDIAPDNIILTADGGVKLIDFGAARYSLGDRSRSLDVVLKHGYAPMEQYTRRGRQGPYTDVYALCATIYKCLTGRTPPDAVDRMDEDNLIPPSALGASIPPQAEDALLKGLEIQYRDRYQSVTELRNDIFADAASLKSETVLPPDSSKASDTRTEKEEHTFSSKDRIKEKNGAGIKRLTAVLISVAVILIAGAIILVAVFSKHQDVAQTEEKALSETSIAEAFSPSTESIVQTDPKTEPQSDAPQSRDAITYTEEDFGDFTVRLPSNWTYEVENGGIYFYESYVHAREDIGSTGYLCDIVGISPSDSDTLRPNARQLGQAGGLEYYVQFPMGVGIIEDETAKEKMQIAYGQVENFVQSVIMK